MSIMDDEEGNSLFIAFHMETKLVRVVGDTLLPSKLAIRADVMPSEDATEADMNAALTKIRFWFDSLVSKSVAFAADNVEAITMFINDEGRNRTSNLLMTTPDEPSDEMLAMLFQAKMTALADGVLDFGLVEVKSDNSMLAFIFVGDGEADLPTMGEWIGERTYFDRPWWSRNDASTLDIIPPADADLTKPPGWAFSLDSLVQPQKQQESGIVVRPEFRPTVIQGGKETDE